MKRLAVLTLALAVPAWGQTNAEDIVRFTGFLGDLRFQASDLRADLFEEDNGSSRIAVVLNPDAAPDFERFTRTHLNQSVRMFVCGEQVALTRVSEVVTSGYAASGQIEVERATAMVDALNGLGACPS